MKFQVNDKKGDFDISLELTEEEGKSMETAVTNLSVGLAGVVVELLHRSCSTREEAERLASLILREEQAALELYVGKFFAAEDDFAQEEEMERSEEEIYQEAWFKDSPYESEDALLAAYADQAPMRLDCRAEDGGVTVFMTNRLRTEVLGRVEGALLQDPEAFETACGMYQIVGKVLGDKLFGKENNPVRTMYFGALRDKVKAALR